MDNPIAPPGAVYVCGACGKRSRDLYGNEKISRGWDVSCVINAILCVEATLVMDGDQVVKADAWDEDPDLDQPSDEKKPLPTPATD